MSRDLTRAEMAAEDDRWEAAAEATDRWTAPSPVPKIRRLVWPFYEIEIEHSSGYVSLAITRRHALWLIRRHLAPSKPWTDVTDEVRHR